MRFKNRYLLFELQWKDGRLDEGLSERRAGEACEVPSLCIA